MFFIVSKIKINNANIEWLTPVELFGMLQTM